MISKVKVILIALGAVALYYVLQYAASAVHYNCQVIKDDCVPPINLASEIIYRVMVQPPWLDQFAIEPAVYFFNDGQFTFWEGKVGEGTIVIRVPEGGSPVMQWIFEERLPGGILIRPAASEHIKQWLEAHPEYGLVAK